MSSQEHDATLPANTTSIDDPERLEILEQARIFKRSWLEMARALVKVRKRRLYEKWGYKDLYDYCAKELMINAAKVDKLTGSFMALENHAPRILRAVEDQSAEAPALDTVDYFARAIRGKAPKEEWQGQIDPDQPVVDVHALRTAVFEERRPVAELRREFNESFFPKEEPDEAATVLKARGLARKLNEVLPKVNGLSRASVSRVAEALAELEHLLESLGEKEKAA